MAVTWGSWDNHLRIGIDIDVSPSSFTHNTTSATRTVRYYVETDGYNFDDDQTLNLSSTFGGASYGFHNNLSSGSKLIVTRTVTDDTSYSGGPSRTFGASLSGAFNGANPTHSRTHSLADRPADVPDKNPTPSVSSTSQTAITIVWDFPNNNGDSIDHYQVKISADSDMDSGFVTELSNDRSYTHSGLSPYDARYFQVRAHNGKGYGAWSNTRGARSDPGVPLAPATPTVSNITSSSARVSWTTPDGQGAGVDDYRIHVERTSDGIDFKTILDSSSPADFTGMARDTEYRVRVQAGNSVGTGPYSAFRTFTTLSTGPDVVAAPTLVSKTANTAILDWANANDGGSALTGYEIQYWPTALGESAAEIVSQGATSQGGLTGLTRFTSYTARVRAVNALGVAPWSATLVFVTNATVPDAGPAPTLENLAPDQVRVNFIAPADGGSAITGYDVQWSTDGFTTQAGLASNLSPSGLIYVATALTPGTIYGFRYRAKNSVGTGAWSLATTIETLSGGKIKVGGVWLNGRAYIKVSGSWLNAKVWKKSGTWNL